MFINSLVSLEVENEIVISGENDELPLGCPRNKKSSNRI